MALLKTVVELRSLLPRLVSSLSNSAGLPNFDKAQRKYLVPICGKALITDLQTKYAANPQTLSSLETELVKHIQLPLAAYGVIDDMAFIQSNMTDNGFRTVSLDKMPAAHRWEYNEIRNTLSDYAMDGVEILLDFLFDNKASFPSWTGSAEYLVLDGFFIKSGTDFAKQYPLYQPLYTYWTLKPIMQDVEENYLAPTLGRDLLAWVKMQDTIEITVSGSPVDVKKFLKKAVAMLTIKHACEHFTPRFDKNGFTVINTGSSDDDSATGRSAASGPQIAAKMQACDRDGQNYLSKAASYLVGIARGQFSEAFDNSFTTAFEFSPLNKPTPALPYTSGNMRRRFFRFS